VEVAAAGVNFADVVIRQGLYQSAKDYVGWPITPGFEFAGRVAAHGRDVSDLSSGQAVFGVTRFGAYASHLCVPRHQVFSIHPASRWSLEQWAAFPTVFLTAYHALHQNVVLRPNMSVLVHSAAGGVGSALVQLCRIAGLRVVAVVGGGHKVEHALALGADEVIDKSGESLWNRARQLSEAGYDLIFDGNGPSTFRQSYHHLVPTGKLVTYGFHSMFSKRGGFPNYVKLAAAYLRIPRWNPLKLVNDNKSIIAFNLSYLFDRRDLLAEAMGRLLPWADDGRIRPTALRCFPFERVADAHRALESGTTVGKLVLTFAEL
jgi:NADPH:quinone reductase-like Zn-dependent oxidoreductase